MFRMVVLVKKQPFPKMGGALFWGGAEGLVDCCCMMLDALDGCSKKL